MLILVHGNAATATKAGSCTGNSSTASKLATARDIKLKGAVSGNASFDGSENVEINVVQSNVVAITGSIELKGNTQGNVEKNEAMLTNWEIDFPTGFNIDNCVCIAFGMRLAENRGFSFGISETSQRSVSMLNGSIFKSVQLGAVTDNSKINCEAWNYNTSNSTYHYKIVLMKIL